MLDGFTKYPSLRDHPIKTAAQWLKGRAIDDGHGQYWRIHDKLYDLTKFIEHHPGGKQWIENTRGQDVTEFFESSHINPSVYTILEKYFVSSVEEPRNVPYTFKQDGFYLTLKRRVHHYLTKKVTREEKDAGRRRVRVVHNRILMSFVSLMMLTALTQSYVMAIVTGIVLMVVVNASHTYAHQRDNWRMYCMDLSLLSSYEYRVVHCMSHHNYPNTLLDFEISVFEPFLDFRVYDKNIMKRYQSLFLLLTMPQVGFFVDALRRVMMIVTGQQKPRLENLLPFLEIAVWVALGVPLMRAVKLWLVMQAASSYVLFIVGLASAHHHPELYHAGDGTFQFGNDWGLAQLDAIRDRNDVNGNLLAEMTAFGNHVLHHLLPALDHGLLDIVRPVFEQTCRDFQLPSPIAECKSPSNQWDMFLGLLRQAARTEPRKLA